MTTLPPHLQPRLDRELDEGEVVRWVAQPSEKILVREAKSNARTLFGGSIVFCALLFSIIVLFWVGKLEDTEEASTIGFVWALIAIVFALGVWAFVSLPKHARYTARNTIYAITDKRAIIIVIHKNKSITERDYRGDELIHLARNEKPDGSGTLTLESARGAGASAQTTGRHRFQAIEDVIGVERMLRKQFGES